MSHKQQFKYPAGIEAKDKVTGFKGTIQSRIVMINGCVQYSLQPKCKKDSTFIPEAYNFDEQNIIPLDEGAVFEPETVEFAYNTGDKVKNRITGFEGHVTVLLADLNRCERYLVEGPMNKDGKETRCKAFAQELTKVSDGLNAAEEKPIERKRTGCVHSKSF